MTLQLFSFCPGGEQALLSRDALQPIELQQEPLPEKPARRRAKDAEGKFKADDPATPEVNEAWEEAREN